MAVKIRTALCPAAEEQDRDWDEVTEWPLESPYRRNGADNEPGLRCKI